MAMRNFPPRRGRRIGGHGFAAVIGDARQGTLRRVFDQGRIGDQRACPRRSACRSPAAAARHRPRRWRRGDGLGRRRRPADPASTSARWTLPSRVMPSAPAASGAEDDGAGEAPARARRGMRRERSSRHAAGFSADMVTAVVNYVNPSAFAWLKRQLRHLPCQALRAEGERRPATSASSVETFARACEACWRGCLTASAWYAAGLVRPWSAGRPRRPSFSRAADPAHRRAGSRHTSCPAPAGSPARWPSWRPARRPDGPADRLPTAARSWAHWSSSPCATAMSGMMPWAWIEWPDGV